MTDERGFKIKVVLFLGYLITSIKFNEKVRIRDCGLTFYPHKHVEAIRKWCRNPHNINRWTFWLVTNEITVKVEREDMTFPSEV
jgi:hypothetical protein